MLSLPRDLLVYIPSGRMGRLNTAYGIGENLSWDPGGGFGLLRQTLFYNFGINVHYHARVNFSGFEAVIDRLAVSMSRSIAPTATCIRCLVVIIAGVLCPPAITTSTDLTPCGMRGRENTPTISTAAAATSKSCGPSGARRASRDCLLPCRACGRSSRKLSIPICPST